MINTNASSFRKNMFNLMDQTLEFNEPININTKKGNLILLSEEDYRGLTETLYLCSIPGMEEKLIEGKNEPLSDCLTSEEVGW